MAAGPWGGSVARLLGHRVALIAQRHQACLVHLPRQLAYTMPSVMDYTPGSGRPGLYFRHETPDKLVAGLHGEEPGEPASDPDSYVRKADERFMEELARQLTYRLPALNEARLGGGWAGLYPSNASGMPFVGPLADDASVVAVAGAGSGIQLSPVLGELVADWVLLGAPRAVEGAHELLPSSGEEEAPAPAG